jgi:DNA-binding LytR/AlgR family response regulator
MRVLIAEDETLIAENLASIVNSCGFEVVAMVEDEKEFIKVLEEQQIDLALLDVRFHSEDLGYRFALILKELNIPFLFITSFSDRETVRQIATYRPYGYVVKPFSREEIKNELNRVAEELELDYITLKSGGDFFRLRRSSIWFMSSENVYVNIHTSMDRIVIRAKLSDLCDGFAADEMLRVHQSYAVNPKLVKRFSDTELQLNDDRIIPISRKYQSDVRLILKP